eukprot:3508858-Amphidinium_carterae.1
MAQTPTQPPIDLVSVPSLTVGTNTQETLPFQQQIENYSGPSLVHGNPCSVHDREALKQQDVLTGQARAELERAHHEIERLYGPSRISQTRT